MEAPRSLDELAAIGRRAPKPTVANMIEQGRTPLRPRDDLAGLGFDLVLYPLTGLYAAARALETVYGALRADGSSAAVTDRLIAFEKFNDIVGVDDRLALAEAYDRAAPEPRGASDQEPPRGA